MDSHQLMLIGRAVKDAEVLESKAGKKYGKFTLATNDYLGEENGEETNFFDILVFNKKVDKLDSIKKGTMMVLTGKPTIEAYLSKKGDPKAKIVTFAKSWRIVK